MNKVLIRKFLTQKKVFFRDYLEKMPTSIYIDRDSFRSTSSSGADAEYYRFWDSSKIGFKVTLSSCNVLPVKTSKRALKLLKNGHFDRWIKECALWNIFYECEVAYLKFTDSVMDSGHFNPVIMLPHITGHEHWDCMESFLQEDLSSSKRSTKTPLLIFFHEMCNSKGFFCHDMHSGNIIVNNKKEVFLIDFEPAHIQVFDSKLLDKEILRIRVFVENQLAETELKLIAEARRSLYGKIAS